MIEYIYSKVFNVTVMPVKNKIKEFIDNRQISVYQFWKDTGIAQRTAYDLYANPNQLPGSGTLEKICDHYEVQPGLLLEWYKNDA